MAPSPLDLVPSVLSNFYIFQYVLKRGGDKALNSMVVPISSFLAVFVTYLIKVYYFSYCTHLLKSLHCPKVDW